MGQKVIRVLYEVDVPLTGIMGATYIVGCVFLALEEDMRTALRVLSILLLLLWVACTCAEVGVYYSSTALLLLI